jgi:hypothetical protein
VQFAKAPAGQKPANFLFNHYLLASPLGGVFHAQAGWAKMDGMSDSELTFRYLNKQGVESNRGFVVQITGRFSLEYRRESFCIECDTEIMPHPPGLTVQVPGLPFGNLTPARRAEIITEIRAALDFMGLAHEVT